MLLSIVSHRQGRPIQKRESTDEHDTDAPSIYRGSAAATDASRPLEWAGASSFDRQPAIAACRADPASRPAGVPAETEGRRKAGQEGIGEAPEKESEGESQEARRQGGRPPREQRTPEDEGQGAAIGQEEALSRLSATVKAIARERLQARIRSRLGS